MPAAILCFVFLCLGRRLASVKEPSLRFGPHIDKSDLCTRSKRNISTALNQIENMYVTQTRLRSRQRPRTGSIGTHSAHSEAAQQANEPDGRNKWPNAAGVG